MACTRRCIERSTTIPRCVNARAWGADRPRFTPRPPPAKGDCSEMSRHLIVLPDDSPKAFLKAIAKAKESLRIKMFIFSDPAMRKAVIAAHKRGVKVRVMLNPVRRDGTGENKATRAALLAAGVEVMDSNPKFPVTHEKSMVVDSKVAFINSLNWDTENLERTRDYAIRTKHPQEVGEIVDCFEADWHRQHFDPGSDARLIWCVGNARE